MLLGDGAHQTALHQIVGANRIAGQCSRVAAQPRDLCLDQAAKIAHSGAPECCARLTGAMGGKVQARCNPLMYRAGPNGKLLYPAVALQSRLMTMRPSCDGAEPLSRL